VKKIALTAATFLLCSVWTIASPSTTTWDGWISDSKCAAKGANAAHAQCAKKCVEGGEKPVLVTDKDQSVVPIENPSAVSGHEGQHVKVTGTLTASGAVHIDKVSEIAGK
jgi:hypothetical protein